MDDVSKLWNSKTPEEQQEAVRKSLKAYAGELMRSPDPVEGISHEQIDASIDAAVAAWRARAEAAEARLASVTEDPMSCSGMLTERSKRPTRNATPIDGMPHSRCNGRTNNYKPGSPASSRNESTPRTCAKPAAVSQRAMVFEVSRTPKVR